MPQRHAVICVTAVTTLLSLLPQARAETIRGKTVTGSGRPLAGVMVSAFDVELRQWTSTFSRSDGSHVIAGLRDTDHMIRTRQMGQQDEYPDDVSAGATDLLIGLQAATGEELEDQRPANSACGIFKFKNARDKQNFRMMCSYCLQIGTIGFRTPEKPVDRETMLRRMDGSGGLYRHTQQTIIPRLISTYQGDAIEKWPMFVPPPAPAGTAAMANITDWEIDKRAEGSFHDMELGPDGLVYAVNISRHYLVSLNPGTGERLIYKFPRGSYGPHCIELGADGNMWFTLCATGQMAKFDLQTKEFTICSSGEAPARRGSYPHTLRINPQNPEGLIWYTDAGRNSCFSLHPETWKVREYHLLQAHQAVAAGKGESREIIPYGLDYSPIDGMIRHSRLKGNRIGRIDPQTEELIEFRLPMRVSYTREIEFDSDGNVWISTSGPARHMERGYGQKNVASNLTCRMPAPRLSGLWNMLLTTGNKM